MPYLTIPQLAERLGLSRTTVYRYVKAGKIPAIKIGRNYVIDEKQISELLSKEITEADKKRIDQAVEKVIKEYGDVIRKLGKE